MKNLLYKEFSMALHPTAIIFLTFSAMMLIPNYPLYTVFFYSTLALFFICLTGRENKDVFYTMLLPVSKRDIVKARMAMAVIFQLLQAVLIVPFMFLRARLPIGANAAGMDANAAFIGLSLVMLGFANLVFFTSYYKDVNKVGKSFLLSSAVTFGFILVAEASAHIVPFVKNNLDTTDSENMPYRLVVLAIGIVVYAILTYTAYRISADRFEKQDI